MVEVKRDDITLVDWTKGISADEFAGGSYYYSEGISSGYSTKGFELGYRYSKYLLNTRPKGNAVSIVPTKNYGFLCFTKDGKIETEDYWNAGGKGALYSTYGANSSDTTEYLNGLMYGKYVFGIKQKRVDILEYESLFDENNQLLPNPDLTTADDWTVGTGWTITDEGAVHTPGNTGTLQTTPTGTYTTSDSMRCIFDISGWTTGNLTFTLGNLSQTFQDRTSGILVVSLRCAATTELVITPSSAFDGTIKTAKLYQYDNATTHNGKITLGNPNNTGQRPALCWEGDLYIASGNWVTIVSLTDRGTRRKELVDEDFSIVSMTQQAGNLILRATNGFDSRQYYWNGVDAVATEVIEWKGLIIQGVTGTETLSYVLTTSGATSGTVEGYEYRLYVVSGYQRNLIASKLFMQQSGGYLDTNHYNINKRFDFNDVKNSQSMTIFLDSLYLPGCDGVYKYGNDVPGLRSAWSRPIKYDTGSENIILGQRGHYLGIALSVNGGNYVGNVDNRLYTNTGYIVSEGIYRDRLSTKKSLEKLKIGYKNVASTVGNIKIYAIVDDTYFWRFRPTSTPTTRPSIGDVYEVANDTTARVIDVDTANGVITFATVSDTGSYPGIANTSLTKVSGNGDDTISVGYNYDNLCLIKTIETENQCYGSDLVFGKDFVRNNMPYRYKIQFVIELNSNDKYLSPEIYEFSIHSDIDDVVL